LQTIDPGTLTLEQVLADILAPFNNVPVEPVLDIECTYRYALVPGPRSTPADPGPMVAIPVDLVNAIRIVPTSPTLAVALATDIRAWYRKVSPPETNARLDLAITMFATLGDQQLPIVELRDIPIAVPPGWL
jgi:hypothetical protein